MEAKRLAIPDVVLLMPKVFEDRRGFFYESFNQKRIQELLEIGGSFVQDNHSRSVKGVIRGLHYQLPPMAQGKLVRVIQGEVFDVAVDIRKQSRTFGQWVGQALSAENKLQLWIPPGFAHGYLTISSQAEVLYKTTEYYSVKQERCIQWDDDDIGIEWPLENQPYLSEKDRIGQSYKQAEVFA